MLDPLGISLLLSLILLSFKRILLCGIIVRSILKHAHCAFTKPHACAKGGKLICGKPARVCRLKERCKVLHSLLRLSLRLLLLLYLILRELFSVALHILRIRKIGIETVCRRLLLCFKRSGVGSIPSVLFRCLRTSVCVLSLGALRRIRLLRKVIAVAAACQTHIGKHFGVCAVCRKVLRIA